MAAEQKKTAVHIQIQTERLSVLGNTENINTTFTPSMAAMVCEIGPMSSDLSSVDTPPGVGVDLG